MKFPKTISLNDKNRWQSAEENFQRARLHYLRLKKKNSLLSFQRKENIHYDNQQSTTTDENDVFKEDIDSSIVNILNICEELEWNVFQ